MKGKVYLAIKSGDSVTSYPLSPIRPFLTTETLEQLTTASTRLICCLNPPTQSVLNKLFKEEQNEQHS